MTNRGKMSRRSIFIALLLSLLIYACGSESAGITKENGEILAGGGQSGTGVSIGSITVGAIDSVGAINDNTISINNMHFDYTDAEIYVEKKLVGTGMEAALSNLTAGQIVRVEGAATNGVESGIAKRVYYQKYIEGPVSGIRVQNVKKNIVISVLGQNAITHRTTQWLGISPGALDIDDIIQVSGHIDETGAIRATFIALVENAEIFTVRGFVDNIDHDERTLRINDLTVDYSVASTSGEDLDSAKMVTVMGFMDHDQTLSASKLEIWNPIGAPVQTTQDAWISGYVNNLESRHFFYVDFYPVIADESTIYIGVTDTNLVNSRVHITGSLYNGNVYADTIEAQNEKNKVIRRGEILSIDPESKTFTIFVERGDIVISKTRVVPSTKINNQDRETVDFGTLQVGDFVRVVGWVLPDESHEASLVKILD